MTGKRDLQRALGQLDQVKANRPRPFPGVLGTHQAGEQVVEVTGRDGFVWVQLRDDLSETIQAYNAAVSPIYGLPVLVVRDELDRTRYKIIGRDTGRYQDWGNSAYLPRHGRQHSFPPRGVAGGGDVVWVYDRQFLPLLGHPSGTPGSNNILIQTHPYWHNDKFTLAGLTGTQGMFNLKPTGSSSARMVLVYLDKNTGNPEIATGALTEFDATVTGTAQLLPYVPGIINTADHIPVSAVRLVTGTAYLGWDNLIDVRPFFTAAGVTGSTGGGGGLSGFHDDSVPYGTTEGGLTDASGLFQFLENNVNLVVGGDVFTPDASSRLGLVSTGSTVGMLMIGYGGASGAGRAFWSTLTARGTPLAPELVQAGDDLFRIQNRPHDGGNFTPGSTVRLIAFAEEDITGSSHGSSLEVRVVPTGSSVPAITTTYFRGGETQFVTAPVRVEENLWVGAFQMPSGSVDGYVLTSDAQGRGRWAAPSGGGGGGGILGAMNWDDGVPVGTGTVFDWGEYLSVSLSGTVARADVGLPDRVQVVYVGKHGDDSNDGLVPEEAFLSIQAGLSAAGAASDADNHVRVHVMDGGTYTGTLTLPEYTSLHARQARLEGKIQTPGHTWAYLRQIVPQVDGDWAYHKNVSGSTSYLEAEEIDLREVGNLAAGIVNQFADGVLIANVKKIFVGNDSAGIGQVGGADFGHIHANVEDLYFANDGGSWGVYKFSGPSSSVVGYIQHILPLGSQTGTVGVRVNAGTLAMTFNQIIADTAYQLEGGELRLICQDIQGDRIVNGGTVWEISDEQVKSAHLHSTVNAQIDATGSMSAFKMATGAVDGYVLTADPEGFGTWEVAPGGGAPGLRGVMTWDDGVPVATGTVLDLGDNLSAQASGSVVRVDSLNFLETIFGYFPDINDASVDVDFVDESHPGYVILGKVVKQNASGWQSPTNATYTVPTGKKALLAWWLWTSATRADAASNRDCRLQNTTDAATILRKGAVDDIYHAAINFTDADGFEGAVAGKTLELQTNHGGADRAVGGFVILKIIDA